MNQRSELQSQGVYKLEQNPNNISLSIPDDKPLSPVSLIKAADKIHLYRKEYQLHIEELQKLDNFGFQDYSNGTYYGQFVNDKRHGRGMMFTLTRVTEGEWQNDRKHGFCKEFFDNGDYFEGEYQNGKPQGQGYYKKQNESYNGSWVNGYKNGHGVWKSGDDFYEGEWKLGRIDGYGVYLHGKDKYTGSFKANLKHGHGVEQFANGDIYNGQYYNGKPEGEGTYIWGNGTEYRGQFKNGVRHGKGVWMKWDLQKEGHYRYDGQFENDKKHGQGVFTWPSGNKYVGSFINDYRHGYGEMYWKDQYYKGQWERGMQHGEGELCKNGVVKKGQFENNVLITNQQRSHSCWEQQDGSFLLNHDTSYNLGKKFKMMPAIGRKPKLMVRERGKSFIMDNSYHNSYIPIEDDPDFLIIPELKQTVKEKKAKTLSIKL